MPRHARFALLALSLLITPASDAFGFDGSRKGFILGMGGGYGDLSGISRYANADGQGVLTELVLGYGVSERWLVHYSGRQIWGSSDGVWYTALFPSVAVTRFKRSESPSMYLTASVGPAVAGDVVFEGGNGTASGPAVFAGIGYEFGEHFGFELVGGLLHSGGNGEYVAVGVTMKALAY